MIVKKALALIAAISAMTAAAGVCVVAAAYALYAFVRLYLDPAPAAAAISVGFALIAGLIALVAFRRAQPESFRARRGEEPLSARLIALAREKPMIAAAAAAAAGFVVLRNPKVLSAIVAAAIAGRARDGDGRRGRR